MRGSGTIKHLSLFNKEVDVVLTEALDGNMKVSPELSSDQLALVKKNRLRAIRALGLYPDLTALIKVDYARDDFCRFVMLDTAAQYNLNKDSPIMYSDGMLTRTPDLGIFLPLADCLGLVLFDQERKVLMLVHCGRHTLLQEGARKAVEYMTKQAETRPENLRAWFSPSAGKTHYPLFDAQNISLQELAVRQLEEAGLSTCQMELSTIDTTTSPNYFSHSQGNRLERFAICAKLPSK